MIHYVDKLIHFIWIKIFVILSTINVLYKEKIKNIKMVAADYVNMQILMDVVLITLHVKCFIALQLEKKIIF